MRKLFNSVGRGVDQKKTGKLVVVVVRLLVIVILLLPKELSAQGTKANVYIDPTFAGTQKGTIDEPYKTVPAMQSNTIYLIKAGTQINGDISGTCDNTTLTRYGTGANPIVKTLDTERTIVLTGTNNSVIGIDILSNSSMTGSGALCFFGNNVLAKDCNIKGGYPGINGHLNSKFTIINCDVSGSIYDGVYMVNVDTVIIDGLKVHDLYSDATNANLSISIDCIHMIGGSRYVLNNVYSDHSAFSGKYALITTVGNIAKNTPNDSLIVTNSTFIGQIATQACVYPAADNATFTNCFFLGAMRSIQNNTKYLKLVNCVADGKNMAVGVEGGEKLNITNCTFTNFPTTVLAPILTGTPTVIVNSLFYKTTKYLNYGYPTGIVTTNNCDFTIDPKFGSNYVITDTSLIRRDIGAFLGTSGGVQTTVPNLVSSNGNIWDSDVFMKNPYAEVTIFDINGRLIARFKGSEEGLNSLKNKTAGIYLYVIDLKNGSKPIKGKIVVMK